MALSDQQRKALEVASRRPAAAVSSGPDLAKRQMESASRRPDDEGGEDGGGLWQLPKGLFEAAQAVPAGVVGMAGDTIDTLHNTARILPTAFAKGIGAARGQSAEDVARIAKDSPLGLGQAFISPDMLRGVPGDPAAQEGLGKWIDENTPLASGEFSAAGHELFPLFGAMGASMSKTVERGTDFAAAGNPIGILSDIAQRKDPLEDLGDTKYVEAWNRGEIVPAALEDLANVSMIAAVGGAGAGRIAGAAGKRAVAAETEISAAKALGGSSDASIAARATRARSVESAARGAEAGFGKVAHLTGRAGDLPATVWKAPGILGKTAGGRFGLFKAGAPAAGLAEKLIPFGAEGSRTGLVGMMRERGLESLVDNLDATNTGARAVDWVQDHPVAAVRKVRMRMEVNEDIRNLDNLAGDARKNIAEGGVLAHRAAKQASRALGADAGTVGAAATMAASKIPESLAEILDDPAKMQVATDELHAAGLIPDADPVLARDRIILDAVGPENVEAFKLASQFSRGTMDPAAAVWFGRVTERMNTKIRIPREDRHLTGEGDARPPTPETLASRKQDVGFEPKDSVVNEAIRPSQQRVEKRRKEFDAAAELEAKAAAKRLDPNFTRPARDIAAEVAPTVPERALGPIERSAQQTGIEGYAQDRARSLFDRPLVDPASAAEVAQGVRREVRAGDQATAASRRFRDADAKASEVLDETGRAALPKDASLLDPGAAAQHRTLPPRERARAVVDDIAPEVPKTQKGRRAAGKQGVEQVRQRVVEKVHAQVEELARESASKFGSESLPLLPFVPPMRADGGATFNRKGGAMDWWTEMSAAERADFARFMEDEPVHARENRMGINEMQRNRGKGNFYEDGDKLHADFQAKSPAVKAGIMNSAVGGLEGAANNLPEYPHQERFDALRSRHANRKGLPDDIDSGNEYAYAGEDDVNWYTDYAQISTEQQRLAKVEKLLTEPVKGGKNAQMAAALEYRDNINPEEFVTFEQIGPGLEAATLTRAEAEAALGAGRFDEATGDFVPYKADERRDLMAAALEEKRTELLARHEEMFARQVDDAFAAVDESQYDAPWKLSRADFREEVTVLGEALDAIEASGLVDEGLAAQYDAYMPEGFVGSLDEIHDQWLHRAEERGLEAALPEPTIVTPDQLADRAIAVTLSKVTDAFDADGGVKGDGYASLTKKERYVYRRMEAAAAEADAGRVVADTRAAVADLQARHRQGIVDDTLDRQALRFGTDAERAGRRAGDTYGARLKSIENVARSIVKEQRKVGVKEGEYRTRARDAARARLRLDQAETRLARDYQRARLSAEATPARYSEGIRARSKTVDAFIAAADRMDQQAPGTGDLLRGLARDISAVDAYTLADVMGDPTHIISGAKRKGPGGGTARNSDLGFIGEPGNAKQKRRRTGQSEYGIKAQIALEAKRLSDQMRNIGVRTMQEKWGRTAAQVTAELDVGRRGGPDLRGLTGVDLAEAADAAGYVAWDPENFTGTVPAASYTPETTLIPKIVKEATKKAFNEEASFLKTIEKWYDRRFMGQIKMFWLALSPRWLTANVVGNAMMGMVGGGVTPWDYWHQMGNARALLAEDAPLEWETGNRLQRRAFDKRQRLVAKGEQLRKQGYELPTQALNRGFTHEELPFLMGEDLTGPKSPVRKLAAHSYRANEYVDNVNRATVYLAKMEPRRKLWEAWDNGEISDAQFAEGFKGTRSPEQALKIALRAAGDFSKMTGFEKSVVKRLVPFYPWYRHITKLAMSMPVYAPARTVWLLHLADVFGGDPDEERGAGKGTKLQAGLPGFAKGSIPLSGGGLLSSAGMNPFESGIESPFFSEEGMLGATTPAFQWPMALLLGKDAKHGLRDFTRPPGDGNLDEYGRPTNTPLAESWGEAGRYLGMQLPQGRLLATGLEDPVLRYDTGDPMISGGNPIPSGRPSGLAGVTLGALGVPTPMSVDAEDIAARTARRREEQAKKRKRYDSQRERLGV